LDVYAKKLDQERSGTVEYLQELARQVAKPTKDELKSLIIEYRAKLDLVKKKFLKII
jgi:recombinational DNA repair ATPase RecF